MSSRLCLGLRWTPQPMWVVLAGRVGKAVPWWDGPARRQQFPLTLHCPFIRTLGGGSWASRRPQGRLWCFPRARGALRPLHLLQEECPSPLCRHPVTWGLFPGP